MTEGAEKTVEQLLEEAAKVTEANTPPKPKKTRTPKADADGATPKPAKIPKAAKTYPVLDAEGNPVLDAEGNATTTTVKPAKAAKPGKLYPQAAEDGTLATEEDGVTPLMGPYATRFKAPKAPKAPKLDADGNPIVRQSNIFALTSTLDKVEGKGAGYRDGSKRKQFFDLVTPGITVEQYYAAAGGKSVGHTYLVWYVNEDQSVGITTGDAKE